MRKGDISDIRRMALAALLLVTLASCGTAADTSPDITVPAVTDTQAVQTAVSQTVTAPVITTEEISAAETTVTETSMTPEETIKPVQAADDLFVNADKDFFVPFADPGHSFCSIDDGLAAPVRRQRTGGCYAYSAVSAMQSRYLKDHGELIDIDPTYIIDRIYSAESLQEDAGYTEEKFYLRKASANDAGGDINRVTAVLCADPLNGYILTGADYIEADTRDDIKDAIMECGAVSVSVNHNAGCEPVHGYRTQNYKDADSDHVVTIVGWDDDFPADGFAVPASQNGAWLAQNFFGEGWGNKGYYWISYDVEMAGAVACEVSDEYSRGVSYGRFAMASLASAELIAHIDEGDLSAAIRAAGDDTGHVTAATVYEESGTIGAVGFWTTIPYQEYTIELHDGSFGEVLSEKSGTFERAGYHTIRLDEPVRVEHFTVVLATSVLGTFEGDPRDVDVLTYNGRTTAHYEAKAAEGRSFVEADGEWVDVTSPELKSKLHLDGVPGTMDMTTIGDPCITVLFV